MKRRYINLAGILLFILVIIMNINSAAVRTQMSWVWRLDLKAAGAATAACGNGLSVLGERILVVELKDLETFWVGASGMNTEGLPVIYL